MPPLEISVRCLLAHIHLASLFVSSRVLFAPRSVFANACTGGAGMSMDTGISRLSPHYTVRAGLRVCRRGGCGPEKPDVKTDAEGQYTLCVHSPPCPWSPL